MDTILERIKKEAQDAAEENFGNEDTIEKVTIFLMDMAISERNQTIEEVHNIIIDYLNDSSDNALQTFNERILSLKINQ